jgi:hypothetical protein
MIFRKRKRVSVIVALIVLLVGLAVWRPWHHESSYHGKPTSYWVNQALQNQNSETIEAIKVLWPEAAMPLLKALKASDS